MNKKLKLEIKYVYIQWMVIFCGVVLISSLIMDFIYKTKSPQNIYYQGMVLCSVIMGSIIIKYKWLDKEA